MGEIALNKIIEELREKSKNYQRHLELKVLDECPFIVEVGALTIGTDETINIITQNTTCPTQFTQKAVDEIIEMNWKNGNGEKVFPIVFGRNDWYGHKLKMMNETLELLENKIQNNTLK
jgi:hypothetical protein